MMNMSNTFFDQNLLHTKYLKKYRRMADDISGTFLFNPHRNYWHLIDSLVEIFNYNKGHAYSFTKRIKSQESDWKNCEAVYTEIILYSYYLKLVGEDIVSDIAIQTNDYDLRIQRSDGSHIYFEAFCIMPCQRISTRGNIKVNSIVSQTQDELSSIRQKLLRKINKQNQMKKCRKNFAVIELNDNRLDDFHILSSLSDGYKIVYGDDGKVMNEGYDWSRTVFNDESTRNLKGIIYFRLGNYQDRKILINPNFNLDGD